ncbi:MAG: hypothetical protein ACYTBJ_17530 [Planctomycetota bacterium]|jgi:hypothetical protein
MRKAIIIAAIVVGILAMAHEGLCTSCVFNGKCYSDSICGLGCECWDGRCFRREP